MKNKTKTIILGIAFLTSIPLLGGCKNKKEKEEEHIHEFKNYIPNDDATCTKDGTKTAKCEKCDVTDTQPNVGSMKDHQWSNWTTIQEPTCLEDGVRQCRCTVCGQTKTDS